ncbi:MAG: transcription elongation factor GreA [Bacilli bacterium]|nr:transcription elongation factor GreA [Bacilli bacterium]MDD3895461.1 transcription elongation factor GreA [Bacilli bacterium]MDD4407450.1 transcription elongation factor GreA [Bacilli bacterium]
MTRKEIHLTSEGFLELETELNTLKTERRPQIIDAIKEARAQGDLSENADYDAARTEQAEVESRITELEYMLSNAKIIEKKKANGVVVLGSIVLIEYIDNKETEEYQIVGSMEADPFENKISNESPIGKAIINKKVGDILSVESPTCSYKIKIIKID